MKKGMRCFRYTLRFVACLHTCTSVKDIFNISTFSTTVSKSNQSVKV